MTGEINKRAPPSETQIKQTQLENAQIANTRAKAASFSKSIYV